MPKLSELRAQTSEWYSTKNIAKNQKVEVTIASFSMEDPFAADMADKGKKKQQVVLRFTDEKKLGLNQTNEIHVQSLLGDEMNDWVGKAIVLYHDPTVRGPQGNITGGLRVRGV